MRYHTRTRVSSGCRFCDVFVLFAFCLFVFLSFCLFVFLSFCLFSILSTDSEDELQDVPEQAKFLEPRQNPAKTHLLRFASLAGGLLPLTGFYLFVCLANKWQFSQWQVAPTCADIQ